MNSGSGDTKHRVERDSMGEMQVPEWALWGASTQRAVENFPVSGRPMPTSILRALGRIKRAAAQANRDLGLLDDARAAAIVAACDAIVAGELDRHFPLDVYQTGSGTSTNMNVNEVIANHAARAAGKSIGSRDMLHPNDHVNMGQSSNDVFPTAMHVATALMVRDALQPALRRVHEQLDRHARAWDGIIKVGRTHLMDASPIRVGQVFGGYAAQMQHALHRTDAALDDLRHNLPVGGTAVGTGINTHARFGRRVCEILSADTGVEFVEAANHVEAQSARDSFVSASGRLKTIAVSLSKIANDIRHLGSGPRCGIGELILPAIQPGSSIMPGKVNPVICESVMQVACRVIGNDATLTTAALGGVGSIFELNVAMPVMAQAMIESIELLAGAYRVFADKLLAGLAVDGNRCAQLLDASLMSITALAPAIGYDRCAALAKQAHEQGKTIRQIVSELNLMPPARLDELLDYDRMTRPTQD